MEIKPNPRQLVLRRDTATGMAQVGWETDLPIGRFQHLELICEPEDSLLPRLESKHYAAYQAACMHAREANTLLLQQQRQQRLVQGYLYVPFELSPDSSALCADQFGNYQNAAMKLLFQLTRNNRQVWVVVYGKTIVHVRPREPNKELDTLAYQVWLHQQLHQLEQIQGQRQEGSLFICESGLWFKPNSAGQ